MHRNLVCFNHLSKCPYSIIAGFGSKTPAAGYCFGQGSSKPKARAECLTKYGSNKALVQKIKNDDVVVAASAIAPAKNLDDLKSNIEIIKN